MSQDWSYQSPMRVLRQRAFLYQKLREFFAARKVMEVMTPVLSSAANTDLQIDMFSTQSLGSGQAAYLRTSPEFFHKRLLASGSGDIFELAPVFRQGEVSQLHNPEFTLLEWYRRDFSWSELQQEVVQLVSELNQAMAQHTVHVHVDSYQSLFQQWAGIDPFNVDDDTLHDRCRQAGYVGSELDRVTALDFLFAIVVQPQLCTYPEEVHLQVIHDFPIEMAALAQPHPEHADRCLRFELLWNGKELANGYEELTDVKEQRRRFEQDNALRQQAGKSMLPIDERLLAALASGLPPCSGVAVGVDRLLMCLLGLTEISQVLGFSADNS